MAAPQLVERDAELSALATLIAGAAGGSGGTVVVEGPAGIGKSGLLAEVRTIAQDAGSVVLHARGSVHEQGFAFGVVRQLFERRLADTTARERLLAGAAASAGAVLTHDMATSEPSDGSFAALHGLFWLTLNIAAEGPLVLAIDDLQAVDRASLRFIAYLSRRLEGVGVLVVAAVRSTDPGTDPRLLDEIVLDTATTRVRPSPLTHRGVAAVVRAALGDAVSDQFCAACAAATAGNPLLLSQLLAGLRAEGVTDASADAGVIDEFGPSAVSRTVFLRLARLAPAALAVARAVAILGEDAPLQHVAALAEVDEDALALAMRDLAGAGILRLDAPAGFVHQLVRDAVYRELAAPERRLWHARAIDVLRAANAPSEQIAAQLLAVEPRGEPWAATLLCEVAQAAVARGAPDVAIAPLRRALEEPLAPEARPLVLVTLGRAEAMTDGPAAIAHLQEAYEVLDEPRWRARTAIGLVQVLAFTGQPDEALRFARRAGEDLPATLVDARHALQAFAGFTVEISGASDPNGYSRYNGAALDPSAGVGAAMLTVLAAWRRATAGDPVEEWFPLVAPSLTDAIVDSDDGLFSVLGVILLTIADRDPFAHAEAVRQAALKRGSVLGEMALTLWLGFAMLRHGELTEAATLLRTAYDGNNRWGQATPAARWSAAFLASTQLEQGDVAAARPTLMLHEDPSISQRGRRWRIAHASILLAEGRTEEALAVAQDAAATIAVDNPAFESWREPMALALARLDRREEAIEVAETDVALARRFGAASTLGRTLRVLGNVAAPGSALQDDSLREAVEVLAGSPARLEHAKALAALGTALRLGRRPTDARDPLRRALDLAERCDAPVLTETIRTEIRATGARPRTNALTGVEALTPSERRVAAMAAAGASNRDIAQELFVTPKTVEVHLSNAYRKLGVRSRRELPALVA